MARDFPRKTAIARHFAKYIITLFGKHPEQAGDVGPYLRLRVVKEQPSVRLGGLLTDLFYRFLFAIASKNCKGTHERESVEEPRFIWLVTLSSGLGMEKFVIINDKKRRLTPEVIV